MSALIGSLVADWWPQIAAGIAAVVGAFTFYLKGRSDQKQKSKQEDRINADETRKAGADARDRVAGDIAAGKLRDSDGWRRD